MGYNFDLSKMPSDMKALFYQAAVKEGDKTKIDSEMEYSIFMSRAKNLMESGKASYSKDVFDNVFSIKIYQNVKTPTENDARRIVKHISNSEQTVQFEKIHDDMYRYTLTIGDVKKLDYCQTIGTIKMRENDCYANRKTYTFYQNGSMEVNDEIDGKTTLYDKNDKVVQ